MAHNEVNVAGAGIPEAVLLKPTARPPSLAGGALAATAGERNGS